ncbi:MAG: type II toxin-antitoxin system VapB family antitoxin [Pseudomonadota bacterium]|nr:type II toxin-antitoxin system VapB family antitoxin [Pseudomonadota bacterium]
MSLKGKASVEELLAIADRAAAHVKRPYVDHAELLYDDNGLPK